MNEEVAAGWAIRPATREDIDAVLVFWSDSDAVPTLTDGPASLARLITGPGGLLQAEVAGPGGGLAGTLIAAWDGWRGNMYRLVIDQRLRRAGLASALVAAGEARLARLGCSRITAPVKTDHPHAVSFWAAVGYTCDPSMTRYIRDL
ncbi:MAG TPA: GNAT family N-acetyltransferase [Streptosporangiaceae bacterium]|nr:GNAT family N-acetyltransferase [Streptosporangiaceae bacterium]